MTLPFFLTNKQLLYIIGGGLPENLPRVFEDNLAAEVDLNSWMLPPVFQWMQTVGNLETKELLRTFNSGIGMVLIVNPSYVDKVVDVLQKNGETVYQIGRMIERTKADVPVVLKNELRRGES